jgi:hypothetical protein
MAALKTAIFFYSRALHRFRFNELSIFIQQRHYFRRTECVISYMFQAGMSIVRFRLAIARHISGNSRYPQPFICQWLVVKYSVGMYQCLPVLTHLCFAVRRYYEPIFIWLSVVLVQQRCKRFKFLVIHNICFRAMSKYRYRERVSYKIKK